MVMVRVKVRVRVMVMVRVKVMVRVRVRVMVMKIKYSRFPSEQIVSPKLKDLTSGELFIFEDLEEEPSYWLKTENKKNKSYYFCVSIEEGRLHAFHGEESVKLVNYILDISY